MNPESKDLFSYFDLIVLVSVVTQYLETHKRLVVPQLGAFIVKEPGRSVLFSELLKRDDGVLRGLLREQGLGDVEAAGEIDRLVFEVRHAVEHGEEYRLEGFGTLKSGPNGTIAFHYDPHPVEPPKEASAKEEQSAAEQLAETFPDVTTANAQPEETSHSEAVHSDARKSAHASQLHPERVAEAVRTAFAEPHVSRSAKMNPDPSVRGLRYGKPPKTTDAYTYVDRPPRRRADWFIWIGVVVAVLALGAIAFGLWNDAREQRAETESIEIPDVTAESDLLPEGDSMLPQGE